MPTHTVLSLTQELATASGQSFLVIDARTEGSTLRLSSAFPSLTAEQWGLLGDGPFAMSFLNAGDAQANLVRILRDLRDESTLVTGTVSLVTPATSVEYDIDDIDEFTDVDLPSAA